MSPAPSTTSPLRRALRRIAVTVAGTVVIAAGIAMLVLPGPGLLTIALGLSLLGREHAWAAALEQRARARLATAARHVRDAARPAPVRPLVRPPAERPEGDEQERAA